MAELLAFLALFYGGAMCATAYAWLGVCRGVVGYAALRDVTGIGDRATLRRLFGLTGRDGAYRTDLAAVLRHRRPSGVIVTDLPVHALLLVCLLWAVLHADAPAAAAIACAAAVHALVIAAAVLSILVRSRQPLIG